MLSWHGKRPEDTRFFVVFVVPKANSVQSQSWSQPSKTASRTLLPTRWHASCSFSPPLWPWLLWPTLRTSQPPKIRRMTSRAASVSVVALIRRPEATNMASTVVHLASTRAAVASTAETVTTTCRASGTATATAPTRALTRVLPTATDLEAEASTPASTVVLAARTTSTDSREADSLAEREEALFVKQQELPKKVSPSEDPGDLSSVVSDTNL
ncbi:hypothetical protein V5799_015832 [Amblyomma americanum]|uniref:Uncharacterized protein n=1 Tax=Amblyomma americanum TaxID=6943 RepID=A0AAQ4F6P9_AMBAM